MKKFVEENRVKISMDGKSRWADNIMIKRWLRHLYFNSGNFSYIINLLFPFRYPIKLDTAIFGGISTSMCTWSGHISASTIFIPFQLHSVLSISPIARRFSPKNTFLRNFGANTMWYLQFQLVFENYLRRSS